MEVTVICDVAPCSPVHSFRMLATIYKSTWWHIPEENSFHSHCHENHKSHISFHMAPVISHINEQDEKSQWPDISHKFRESYTTYWCLNFHEKTSIYSSLTRSKPSKNEQSIYQNYSYTPYVAPSTSGYPVLEHLCLPHPTDVQFLSAPQKETDKK